MKTKIITLESHDDLISVRDKLSWAKTPRILLVWPKYEKVTLRLLDLKVLQRHADSLGAQLGLVTRRSNVRRDAESLGIPVFTSTSSAQKDAWTESTARAQRTPKPPRSDLRQMRDEVYMKEPAWRTSLLGRVVTFTVGVAAVLVLAGVFVPRAAVTLYPESMDASIVIPVSASPSISSVSITGNVPSHSISVTVSNSQTMSVTSQISISMSKAKGVVQFTNLGADEIAIPAGTIVSTESLIHFATLNDTRLPAGADQIVEVQIEATDAGANGNVEAGAIHLIEGPLGLSATVTNLEPTTGGSDSKVMGASDDERAQLRTTVLSKLQEHALSQIRSQIGANDLLLDDTLEMGNIQKEEYAPPEGEAGATLTLTMQAEFSARYILVNDLRQLASSAVLASIPQGFSPFGDMTFSFLNSPATDSSGVTHFQLQASQAALRDVDRMQLFNLIRGHNPIDAQNELAKQFAFRQPPEISLTPSWWKWLPLIPFNISVEVK